MRASRRLQVTGARLFGLVAAVSFAFLGCRSLDRFDTSGAPAYCGTILKAPLFQDGLLPDGAEPGLNLRLEIDTDRLTTRPGTLTSNDAVFGLCSGKGGALFQDAELRAIEEIVHDSLSNLEFGDGHQHDFFAWVDSTCQGTMLAVVSLLTNGSVEVRLLKPAAEPPDGAGSEMRPGFALFYMRRSETGCGF
jgi:hypothetical protein